MADSFGDLPSKLGPPTKKSLFERQKAEAEAKKAREKAETAAVYEDFVKSFDEDGESSRLKTPARSVASSGMSHSAAPGKRHFTSAGLRSGPGSLGPNPGFQKSGIGSLGPAPASQSRKRPYETAESDRRGRDLGVLSFDDGRREQHDIDAGDNNEDKAAAKPTLHLSSLPPGTSPAVIRALLTPSPLVVEDVRMLPPSSPSAASSAERKSMSAIVTLAAETSSTDIETLVSHLQNRYLGFGYHLSISRHLSSAALGGVHALTAPSGRFSNLPFGAKIIPQHTSLSRAPPPGHNRVPPPSSYTSSTPYSARDNLPPTEVIVRPPSDLKQLKLIHKTLEALLTHGPEFEALLMSRPQIQRDEKWSWLWDSRSVAGVYYRWRLWDLLTGTGGKSGRGFPGRQILFEGQSSWQAGDAGLRFEFLTGMDEFISDEDYDSSDEEADNDGGIARRYNDHNIPGAASADPLESSEGVGYLNPLAKSKLVHLLSRLPENHAKLRKGDVARLTGFAIEHAGAGAEEVAQLITRNVVEPLSFARKKDQDDPDSIDGSGEDTEDNQRAQDKSAASLVGLYVVSDLLSSSANAGVRHAWRYRSLFETALRQQQVLEKLGRLDKDLRWGKLKAEKWKRSVQSILSLWEGWCVFSQAAQAEFTDRFLNPPLTDREKRIAEAEQERRDAEAQSSRSNGKWRALAEDQAATPSEDVTMEDVDGVAMAGDVDGSAMAEEDLVDEDLDGMPMMDSSDDDEAGVEASDPPETAVHRSEAAREDFSEPAAPIRRQRMKAVDMFADDSDG